MGSPVNSWSRWGSSEGKPDWAVNPDDLTKLRRTNSFELGSNGEEPDLSWVQSLVKESPTDFKEKEAMATSSFMGENPHLNPNHESGEQSEIPGWVD